MISYAVEDENGVQFELNGLSIEKPRRSSLRQGDDSFDWENKIIQKTYLPGSSKIGVSRLEQRELTFVQDHVRDNDNDFRDDYNQLLYNLEKAVYLIDLTNSLKIKVTLSSSDSNPRGGTERRVTEESFTFVCLNPFWEMIAEDEATQSLTGSTFNDIAINNEGYLDAYPVLTFTTSVAVDDILINIPEINQSYQIQDNVFGTASYDTLIIDNAEGTTDLSGLNRNSFIVSGTGFIRFPVGSSTLRIFPSANCNVSVKWNRRYYV